MAKFVAIGTRSLTKNGYVRIKTGEGRSPYEHVAVAELALGKPMPVGARVHHVDLDGTHNWNSNLCILQNEAEHQHLHARLRILRAGGDPWRDSWCCGCQAPRPVDQFCRYRRGTERNRTNNSCLSCERIRVRAWNARKRLERAGYAALGGAA